MTKHAKHKLKILLGVLASLTMMTSPLGAAPPEGKGKPDKMHKHEKAKNSHRNKRDFDAPIAVDVRFDDIRRLAIANHYTGYESLPPGIQKNLARGKPLPPGIAKKVVPGPLLRELPVYPGYEWRVYGTDLILIGIATNVIQQVLAGVFQ